MLASVVSEHTSLKPSCKAAEAEEAARQELVRQQRAAKRALLKARAACGV